MQKTSKIIISIVIALAWLLAQFSIGNLLPIVVGKKIWLSNDENTLKQNVGNHIAAGSSVADAKGLLEVNGFECIYGMQTNLDPENGWGLGELDKYRLSKDGEYLICYLGVSRLLYGKKYRLAIPYKHEAIIDVNARIEKWEL
jgi:hypothetical protein